MQKGSLNTKDAMLGTTFSPNYNCVGRQGRAYRARDMNLITGIQVCLVYAWLGGRILPRQTERGFVD